ncbi:MAG: heterodisulfide reductase-related iron-sulfur binding cluster [Anaerolineales bacterium]|jgi:Fe-S oxidoreductase/nitrate reductase gamma subunit
MTTDAIPTHPDKQPLSELIKQNLPRVRDFFLHAIGQVRILRKPYPGIMHLLIFWGVTIQVIGTAINLMQMALFIPFVELPFPRGNGYLLYELIMDLAGIAILVGVVLAAYRRTFTRPKTLDTSWDDVYILIMLALIPIMGFTLESLRLLSVSPEWARWSPIGFILANILQALGVTPESAASWHQILLLTHVTLALVLIASIPFTKLRHLLVAPLNVTLRPRRELGTLDKIDDIEEAEILGVGQITKFTPQQIMSFEACVRCGRCEEVCPAYICGMDYTPKSFIQSLRGAVEDNLIFPNGNADTELLGEILDEQMPWSCTTCGACLSRCPVFVNPVDEIIDLRRYQALMTGKLPKSVADVLRNMERQGNPWGMPAEDRIAWTKDLDIREIQPGEETEVLLFLGCAFAYDERNKKVTRSFVQVLKQAGIDFAILGLDEICCGETARRLGHEYLFQIFAEQNIDALSQVKFNRIVTQCPHCFNTLKNEYPQMGGDFNIQHYSEYLAGLELPAFETPANGNGVQGKITYHDSCYLGRYNDIYDQPRDLLTQAQVDLVEMRLNEENSFCCGGGGGQMWMETDADKRINQHRLDDALEVEVDTVATACPYCLLMFDDAIRSKGLGDQIKVMDLSEIIEQQLSGTRMEEPS